ncbi:response regulator transcription factor [Neobacillus sp. MM2021_6]|uniref:response regulator transcription factor n=1 Tax=Bacillaceae TaxID=186817 RepID=UPI001408487C|nr:MULTISPECIES: response regulator transcription factor [Bacillaceae]MBO0958760.1 response regulator transcription factor [Neobacillus sp. MM2021_6]NHC18146.1 response regulator transcription factor [Bacillus sp. MM2020_4]
MFRVLLADDETLITLGLQALLDWEDYGFEIVYTAESGEEALSFLKDHPVDLLITDILMGEMSGLELIKAAREIQPQMKSIVLTGYQEFGFIKQGLLLGIENYLVKPVDEEELLTTIQNVGQKLKAVMGSDHPQETTTLRDNTLWRFINGEIDKNDVLERMALYDIQFTQPHYLVSILNFEHYYRTPILTDIRNFIEEYYSATCLYSPNQELIILFGSTNEEELGKWNKHLVSQLCEEQRGIGQFYLSMGKPVHTIDELEKSFTIASEYSLLQLYSEPNVLLSGRISADKQDELKKQQEFKENIVKQLVKANEETLQMVDLFFQYLTRKAKFISPQVAKKYTFDLISYIHYSIQPDDLSEYTAAVEKMVYSSDVTQLKAILKEYCHGLLLSINNQVQMRSPIVQNVLKFIHAHYDEGISLKTLGQQFHVNAIYLGQLFQKEVGVVFSEYLNRYRLEKAKELLKTTHYRAGEIGKKVGYSDTTYFYKQFKKTVGTTPSEWRKI